MSDYAQGPGWWEASDGKWYAPELHPDNQAGAAGPPPSYEPPSFQPPSYEPPSFPPPQQQPPNFAPPQAGERVPNPSFPPPGGYGNPPGSVPPGSLSAGQAGLPPGQQLYPPVRKKKSGGKIVAIVFGSIFLLLAGGCGVFLWAFREPIGDATVDFSDAEFVTDSASCEITGLDFAEDYEVEATLVASSATVRSNYQIQYEIIGDAGFSLGQDETVFRGVEPGETRTESVFNVIDATDPVALTTCEVIAVFRVDA